MPSILDLFGMGGGAPGVSPFASIFDSILGRKAAGPSLPGQAMPQRQASSNDPAAPPSMLGQGLLSAGQNLLSAGTPTTQPTGLLPALYASMGRRDDPNQWPLRPRPPWGMR